jgi:RNAse P Rpr2/Rpp21/SNM1 subunit domain
MSGSTRLRFLWSAANMLQARAPAVSRVLGARLVLSAGRDGMSAAAQRLHCAACSALLAPRARVRIRPGRRRRRPRRGATRGNGEPAAVKNRVVRTCEQCLARNYHDGSRKGESDVAMEWAAVRDPHAHEVNASGRGMKRVGCDSGPASNPTENDIGINGPGPVVRRKKRKKANPIAAGFLKKPDSQRAQNDPACLSSSFLFQPL